MTCRTCGNLLPEIWVFGTGSVIVGACDRCVCRQCGTARSEGDRACRCCGCEFDLSDAPELAEAPTWRMPMFAEEGA